jgi:LuxR family maltose regulon positive regulatory protein
VAAQQIQRGRTLSTTVLESKLSAPFTRPGLVERTALLDRLAAERGPTVLSVVAPAGYGKSTLLHQWTVRDGRQHGWLTLDADDNDPVLLLTYLATALDRLSPVDPDLFRSLAAEHPTVPAITRALGAEVATWQQPSVLVLDDVHVLENPVCLDVIALVTEQVPEGSRVALASRDAPPVRAPRLRAEGRILEIESRELALEAAEVAELLRGAGVELSDPDVTALADATEGWAVAVYLTARSISARGRAATLDLANLGRSRHIAAYAHAELLSALPAPTVQFLTRTSILDRMSGPLCDAVLRTVGSAQRLEAMARSNLLVTPLDDHRTWYRYHHLFRDLLRAELEVREPDLVRELHDRAAQWYQGNGLPDAAVEHAMVADDVDRTASLVRERALALYRTGRASTLLRWLEWLDHGGHLARYPAVAAAGAWTAALSGRPVAAERWADAAEQSTSAVHDGPGSSVQGRLALLRALLCRSGMRDALADARTAERLLGPGDAWRATVLVVLGLTELLTGSPGAADGRFLQAADVGRETGAWPAVSVALAERAVIALGRGDRAGARGLSGDAYDVVVDRHLQDHVTNVLVFAVAARVGLHERDIDRAERLVVQAQRLRPGLTYAVPHFAVQARLELTRVLLGLGDGPGARTLLREVDHLAELRPRLGVLAGEADELRRQTANTPLGAVGASTLTGAELRLLPLLQTHLTFREIGERLFVSPHTVKTQAISIYRKLGVSSRSDAVRRATGIGLLPH